MERFSERAKHFTAWFHLGTTNTLEDCYWKKGKEKTIYEIVIL